MIASAEGGVNSAVLKRRSRKVHCQKIPEIESYSHDHCDKQVLGKLLHRVLKRDPSWHLSRDRQQDLCDRKR